MLAKTEANLFFFEAYCTFGKICTKPIANPTNSCNINAKPKGSVQRSVMGHADQSSWT
jgi:hypothetical protein